MKKLFMFVCAALLSGSAMAQKITVEDVAILPGGEAQLVIKAEAEAAPCGAGFKLFFNDSGVDIKKNANGKITKAASYSRGDLIAENEDEIDYSITITEIEGGYDFTIIDQAENAAFQGNKGVLITLNLTAPEGATLGSYKGKITNAELLKTPTDAYTVDPEEFEFEIAVYEPYVEPEGTHKLANGLGKLTPGEYTNISGYGGTWSGNSIVNERDWSKFDYLWIKYKDFSGAINFGIMYSEWIASQSWGEQYKDETVAIKDAEGVIGIKINHTSVYENGNAKVDGAYKGDTYDKHIREIFIQATAGGSNITIEEMWLGSAADYKAAGGFVPERPEAGGSMTMWEGTKVFDGWGVTDVIDPLYFSVAEVGDIIYCTVQDVAEGDDFNPLFKHPQDWSDFTELLTNEFDKGETYFKATINAEALASLQANGLRFQGVGFTLTKVELQVPDPTGIKSLNKIEKNGAIYNLAGQKVDKNYKGIVIVNGKKVMNK